MKDGEAHPFNVVHDHGYGINISHKLRRFWTWLISPSARPQQPDLLHQSQLLAGLLAVVIFLGVLIQGFMFLFAPAEDRADWLAIPTFFLLGLAFVLNRFGHFSASAWIAIVIQSVAVFVATFNTGNRPVDINFLIFLIIPLLFASMFLAEKIVLVLALVYILSLGLSPAFVPGINLVGVLSGPVSFMAIVTGMIHLIIHHRKVLETYRQRELVESEERYRQLVDNTPDFIYSLDRESRYVAVNRSVCQALNLPIGEIIGKKQEELGFPKYVVNEWLSWIERVFETGEVTIAETTVPMPDGTLSTFEVTLNPIFDITGNVSGVRGWNRDISVLKRAEKELYRVNRALHVLSECNQALVRADNETELLNEICRIIVDRGKYRFAWVGYALEDETKTVRPISFAGYEAGYLQAIRVSWSDDEFGRGPVGSAIRTGQPVIVNDIQADPDFRHWREEAQGRGLTSVIALPLFDSSKPFGALAIFGDAIDISDETEIELLKELASDLAFGVLSLRTRAQHEKAEEKIHHQLQNLASLRAIDLAITSSLDLRVVFDVLLDKVIGQLHLDAACILLLNPHTQILEYAVGKGFQTQALQHTNLRLGEGQAGLAALERRMINIPNLQSHGTDFLRSPSFPREGFVSYYAIPLIAKGVVKGVMEVFHRSSLDPDNEWLEFLKALAGQAVIALDNASLFTELQRSNTELILAYDTTIEGWSKALDLRDKETEGHSRRVTEMTIKLAREMGVKDAEIVHIRRGALLHDIGKMGIPDQILLKPSNLTDQEQEIMRKHPDYAYDLLSPIQYLRPALDIPYCHHEKWDGTGYPRRLKGEQIPLAARIFAVVDVWDALNSARPYRPAWPDEKIVDYIRDQSGNHFDPQVVERFLAVLDDRKA